MKNMRVVKVIDRSHIVINVGASDGISYTDRFVVFAVDSDDIIDPETGENLGKVEYIRGMAKPSHIQNRMTTLVAYSVSTNPLAILSQSLYDTEPQTEFQHVYEGDYVRQIPSPEQKKISGKP